MLPDVPTTSANVLVAFATIGDVPKNNNVGNVSSVPPPATALIAPPRPATTSRAVISVHPTRGQINEATPKLKIALANPSFVLTSAISRVICGL